MSQKSNKNRRAESTSSDVEVGVSEVLSGQSQTLSAADVEAIVERAVKAAVKVVMEELRKKMQDMDDYIRHLEARIDSLESKAAPSLDVSDLNQKIDAVACENRRYAVAANEAEQYGRRNNIRIKGLPVKKDEDCRQVVTEFIRSKLNVRISDSDIEIAHVIPNRAPATGRSQSQQHSRERKDVIFTRFQERAVRDKVIRQRKLLKDTAFTIVEDLTSLNLEVINRLKNTPEVDKTWSWNGHIYALLRNGNKIKMKPFQTIANCEQVIAS